MEVSDEIRGNSKSIYGNGISMRDFIIFIGNTIGQWWFAGGLVGFNGGLMGFDGI